MMFCIIDFCQTTNRKVNCVQTRKKNHFISSTPLKGPPDKSQPRITSSSRPTIIFATRPGYRWNVVSLFRCDLVNKKPLSPLVIPHLFCPSIVSRSRQRIRVNRTKCEILHFHHIFRCV